MGRVYQRRARRRALRAAQAARAICLAASCAGLLWAVSGRASVPDTMIIFPPSNEAAKRDRLEVRPPSILDMIEVEARRQGVPIPLAVAIAKQESSLIPWKIGDHGLAYGLYQLHCGLQHGKPLTAQVIGFKGRCAELLNPERGIFWGVRHLKLALAAADGNWCKAAALHQAGLHAAPAITPYCLKVLEKIG